MNKRQFIRSRRVAWRRFEGLLRQSGSFKKASRKEISEFSRLFRELSNDLAVIRSRSWGGSLVSFLNHLVVRGHSRFYTAPPGNFHQVIRFLAYGFPQLLRENFGYFLTAAVLFFLPGAISWAVIQNNPSLAGRVIPADVLEQFDQMYAGPTGKVSPENPNEVTHSGDAAGEPGSAPSPFQESDEEPDPRGGEIPFGGFDETRAIMAGFYVRHNVGIALTCFARGILLGLGTAYTLLFNGIVIGAIGGYVISQGHSERFLSFVVSHGSFELTAIAVAGAGGLMLGNALLHPGQRTRLESLRVRGLEAVKIASGAAVMLVIAALIEAFWSPSPVPSGIKYLVGAALWILVFLYLALAGRDK